MSLLQRIHDRLTGVLGRDCKGKPLRVGDRVVPTAPAGMEVNPRFDCVLTVAGSATTPGWLKCLTPDGADCYGPPAHVRRLDDPKDDSASWDEVTKLTGWTPKTVKRQDEVPA